MSMPPEIIQVKRLKRKAHDDDDEQGAVNYLRIDDKDRKRYRSDAYVYQRTTQNALEAENNAAPKPSRDAVPVIHSSKPADEKPSLGEATSTPTLTSATKAQNATKKEPAPLGETPTAPQPSSATEPRRFHFSRPMIRPSSLVTTSLKTGKRSRLNTPTATMFVERGHKRTRTEDVPMRDAGPTAGTADADEPPRKLKLPGSDRKGPRAQKSAEPLRRELPASMKKHWAGDDMDEITRNMNDFALQLIGANLAEMEERDRKEAAAAARKEASSTASTPQKFKPKPPAKRYAERHPEVAAARQGAPGAADQEESETASDDEYVVETYVRVPASSLSKDIAPEKVGLLVFDNEPDADFFYGEEGDSDDEWPEDDEDENAENYYTADYPDDEVDSEDEYDRGAYQYRTGNASDLEEFDERDDDYVLDHDDNGDMPFSARLGAMPPSAFRGI